MQLLLVATTLAAPVFSFVDHPILHVMWYVCRMLCATKQVETVHFSAGVQSASIKRSNLLEYQVFSILIQSPSRMMGISLSVIMSSVSQKLQQNV
jgi:hypothetical protein